jgi:hypothetical protein
MQYHAMARLVNQQDLGLAHRSYQRPLRHDQLEGPDAQNDNDSTIDDCESSD